MKKSDIRKIVLKQRDLLSESYIALESKKIVETIKSLEKYKKAKKVWLFANLKWEIDLFGLLETWVDKIFYFPKVVWDNIQFWKVWKKDDLKKWSFGVLEPENIDLNVNLDLIIVPWLAFTQDLKRIGYWKWYYDKYLQSKDVYKIWVCFDFQVFDDFDQGVFDVRMDKIISTS